MIPPLDGSERFALLRLARAAIEERLTDRATVASTLDRVEITPGLEIPRGVFISLKQPGDEGTTLRGCIGTMAESHPLYRAVLETAPRAATDDPRQRMIISVGAFAVVGVAVRAVKLDHRAPAAHRRVPDRLVLVPERLCQKRRDERDVQRRQRRARRREHPPAQA